MTPQRVEHPLAPVWDARSRVLLLGTMPSPRSRAQGFYYGHPQNRFWRVLAAVLGEPLPQSIPEKRGMLLRRGIALWDVLASCEIVGASDASIRNPVPNDLGPLLAGAPIRAVFATGGQAARLYRRWQQPSTGLPITQLPSTSPANCACSWEALCQAYGAILPWLEGPKSV